MNTLISIIIATLLFTNITFGVEFSCKNAVNDLARSENTAQLKALNLTFKNNYELFLKKYPENTSILKSIDTKILAISTFNLTAIEKDQLLKDYIELFSENMITFTGTSHLYTRFEKNVFDFYLGGIGRKPYSLTTGNRFEPILLLSKSEYINLSTYIKNAELNPGETLGEMETNSVRQYNEKASLSNNRPNIGKHGCASWICSAPIGDKKESLSELAGGNNYNMDYPETLMTRLINKTNKRRSPLTLYWTDQELDIKSSKEIFHMLASRPKEPEKPAPELDLDFEFEFEFEFEFDEYD